MRVPYMYLVPRTISIVTFLAPLLARTSAQTAYHCSTKPARNQARTPCRKGWQEADSATTHIPASSQALPAPKTPHVPD